VPVVTRAGDVHMSRVGASLLHAAGLDDLVTHNAVEYIETAVALAGDGERRRELRSILRRRLENSTLLDHAGFTRKLEQVYRDALAAVGT
jgi:predicted O-linked N-acetylglucosamine transferase (SPINDLY family)